MWQNSKEECCEVIFCGVEAFDSKQLCKNLRNISAKNDNFRNIKMWKQSNVILCLSVLNIKENMKDRIILYQNSSRMVYNNHLRMWRVFVLVDETYVRCVEFLIEFWKQRLTIQRKTLTHWLLYGKRAAGKFCAFHCWPNTTDYWYVLILMVSCFSFQAWN